MCVVDVSKEVYNVTLIGDRRSTISTLVSIDGYAKDCGQGPKRTLRISGTNLSIACFIYLNQK